MSDQPRKGHERAILGAFLNGAGQVSRTDLIQALLGRPFSPDEGIQCYRTSIKPAMSRLRSRLRASLALPAGFDPMPFETDGYRLLVEIGFVEIENHGRPHFARRHGGAT